MWNLPYAFATWVAAALYRGRRLEEAECPVRSAFRSCAYYFSFFVISRSELQPPLVALLIFITVYCWYIMGLAHIIFNKSNKTLWSVTLRIVWFNTIRDFDWTLTQLIWLEIIHLNWEAEKRVKTRHTRACRRRRRRGRRTGGRGQSFAT